MSRSRKNRRPASAWPATSRARQIARPSPIATAATGKPSPSECKACHTEHKGRTFDIVQLNRDTFNHAFANFTLTGSHKRAGCDGCHVKNTKYRETPGRCFDCHTSIDPH